MLTAFKVKDNRGYGEKERRAGTSEQGQENKGRGISGLEDIVL